MYNCIIGFNYSFHFVFIYHLNTTFCQWYNNVTHNSSFFHFCFFFLFHSFKCTFTNLSRNNFFLDFFLNFFFFCNFWIIIYMTHLYNYKKNSVCSFYCFLKFSIPKCFQWTQYCILHRNSIFSSFAFMIRKNWWRQKKTEILWIRSETEKQSKKQIQILRCEF